MLENPFYYNEDAKAERGFLRKVIAVLGVICFIALIALATNAHATEIPVHVSEQNGIVVRLMPGPCVDPVSLSLIQPTHHARFKAIQSFWPQKDGSMKAHAGCWTELTKIEARSDEEVFVLVFDDGESGAVPKSQFVRKSGQTGA